MVIIEQKNACDSQGRNYYVYIYIGSTISLASYGLLCFNGTLPILWKLKGGSSHIKIMANAKEMLKLMKKSDPNCLVIHNKMAERRNREQKEKKRKEY